MSFVDHLGVQLGWCCVPETVVRREGPFGLGSIQRYVPEDGTSHYFTLRDEDRWERELVAICAFDVVANNADRKSGHVLLAEDRLFAIDNGLCFHVEPKLRTVIWDFASQRLPERLHDDLVRLKTEGPSGALAELLDDDELEALTERAEALQWMFFEQHALEPNIGAAYFWLALVKGGRDLQTHALEDWMERGYAALQVMENHLKAHDYFAAGQITVADIALYGYTHVADRCDYDLATFPRIRAWLRRVEQTPGFVAMDWRPGIEVGESPELSAGIAAGA